MNGWDVINSVVAVISRLPIERLVPQKADRDLDDLSRRLEELGRGTSQVIPIAFPTQSTPVPEADVELSEIRTGVAGKLCSDEHIAQTASDLKEALRMAYSRGIKDREIRERLLAARDELNAMERFDMTAQKIDQYTPQEQVIARWLLPKSAEMRHSINEILMRDKQIQDLEHLSAYASGVARDLTDKIDALPREQKEGDACLVIKRLPEFIEQRRMRGEETK